MENHRVLQWNVDTDELHRLQNAKVGEYFIFPDKFTSPQLSCEVLIYPNGFCTKEKGHCNLYMVAHCNAKHRGNINIKYHLKCNGLNIEWNNTACFNQKNTNHRLHDILNNQQLLELKNALFECKIEIISPKQRKPNAYTRALYTPEYIQNESSILWYFNHSEIQRLINVPTGKHVISPIFLLHDLEWDIHCLPNGNLSYAGDFTLYLELMHIADQIHSLQSIISLFIPETKTRYYKQFTFYRNCDNCLLLSSGYLPIRSLFTLDALHIIIRIDIGRINFSFQEHGIGKMMRWNCVKLSNKTCFEWNISSDECMLMQLKNSAMKRMWASDRFDCWYLRFAPNGTSMHNKGQSILSLCCLELPSQFGAIVANIRLKCMGYTWKHTVAFKFRANGSESGWSSWPDDIMSFNEFCRMDKVIFVCDIDIIAIYDRNGYEITEKEYRKSLIINRNKADEKEKNEMIHCEHKYEYETPGFIVDDDDVKDAQRYDINDNDNMELQQQIHELQKKVSYLEMRNTLQQTKVNNNGNHIESFEKWYKMNIELPEYYELFMNEGYDSLIAWSDLNDDDLIELGVSKKGHRLKILKTIQRIQF